jgi:hypothetical protein
MVPIGYSSLSFVGACPHCGSPLFELSDMWGPLYACEECGYEFDPLELEPKHLQPQSQAAFAGSSWLNWDNGSNGRRMIWEVSGAVSSMPLRR